MLPIVSGVQAVRVEPGLESQVVLHQQPSSGAVEAKREPAEA
jgi:hypothetical protein